MTATEFPLLGDKRYIGSVEPAREEDWLAKLALKQRDELSVELTIRGKRYLLVSARVATAPRRRKAIIWMVCEAIRFYKYPDYALTWVSTNQLESLMAAGDDSSRLSRELVAHLGFCGVCTTDSDDSKYSYVATDFIDYSDVTVGDMKSKTPGGLEEWGWHSDICLIFSLSN
jgi:hypothetical protein